MPNNTKLSTVALNAQLTALGELANEGYLRIYAGNQPASPDIKPSDQMLLVELQFSRIAFNDPISNINGGYISANKIFGKKPSFQTGVPAWFRVYMKDSVTPLWDGNVGQNDASLILDSNKIEKDSEIEILHFVHRLPNINN